LRIHFGFYYDFSGVDPTFRTLNTLHPRRMKAQQLVRSVGLFLLFTIGCSTENPNKAKALQLFREINEIAQTTRVQAREDDVIGTLKRLNELRDHFPANRSETEDVARTAKNYFSNVIDDNQKIINKSNELLSLGLVPNEANCVRLSLESQWLENDLLKLTIDQLDLLFDENIKDKETLESRTGPIKEKRDILEAKMADNEDIMIAQCSKLSFGIKK
jgi:hypothetical protein